MNKTGSNLRDLRHNLRAWARTRLWAQVLIGLVLGIGVGAILGPDLELVPEDSGAIIGPWLAIPGRVFLGLISLVLVPLVLVVSSLLMLKRTPLRVEGVGCWSHSRCKPVLSGPSPLASRRRRGESRRTRARDTARPVPPGSKRSCDP